jgi:hypothetical protein
VRWPSQIAYGTTPDAHAAQVRAYFDAEVDEVCVQQFGSDMDGFFAGWEREVLA